MKPLSVRTPRVVSVVALVGVFVLGALASSIVQVNAAHAQSFASSVVVPREGLAFRTPDGRLLARLSSGPNGGVFELFDSAEHPIAPAGVNAFTGGRRATAWSGGEVDDTLVDPWTARAAPRLPSSGL